MVQDLKGRFEMERVRGTGMTLMVVTDRATGVQYLCLSTGGITPLVNADGTPHVVK